MLKVRPPRSSPLVAIAALLTAVPSVGAGPAPATSPVPIRQTAVFVTSGHSDADDRIAAHLRARFDVVRKEASLPFDAGVGKAHVVVVGPSADPRGAAKYADLSVPLVAVGGRAWLSQRLVDTRPPATLDREHDVVDYDPKAPPRATIGSTKLSTPPIFDPLAILSSGLSSASPCDPSARVTQVERPSMARSILSLPPRTAGATPLTVAFAYPSGVSTQDDFLAPERRAGLPACEDGAGKLVAYSPAGWRLFDAVMDFAATPIFVTRGAPDPSQKLSPGVLSPQHDPALDFVIVHARSLDIAYKAAPAVVPVPGLVLVGDAMRGYLRRADAVQQTSRWTYRVDTSAASMTDLFRDGHFDLSGPPVHIGP